MDKEELLNELHILDGVLVYNDFPENSDRLFEILITLKNNASLPIWTYSKHQKATNRRIHLELGAVGSIGGDTSVEELWLIIENMLKIIFSNKHKEKLKIKNPNIQKKEEFFLSKENLCLNVKEIHIELTRKEFLLVQLLTNSPNKGISNVEIYRHVWGGELSEETILNTRLYRIANVIFHLRNKLRQGGLNPRIIRTVRSTGYLFDTKQI